MKDLLHSYLATALWSSTGDDDEPLDKRYGIESFAPEAIEQATRDCAAFESQVRAYLDASGQSDARAGHDFWLTRNRHGAGFWDGDWPDDVADDLTDIAHAFGETDAYIGDDGLVYFSR